MPSQERRIESCGKWGDDFSHGHRGKTRFSSVVGAASAGQIPICRVLVQEKRLGDLEFLLTGFLLPESRIAYRTRMHKPAGCFGASAQALQHFLFEGIQDGHVEVREITFVPSGHGEAMNARRGGHHSILT
jgi:hypothetical protein